MSLINNIKSLNLIDKSESALSERILKTQFKRLQQQTINLLFIGNNATGKNSTINALFDTSQWATTQIGRFSCLQKNNIACWQTSFPTALEQNRQFKNELDILLNEKDAYGSPLIDLTIVIEDAGLENFENFYHNISEYLASNLKSDHNGQILIALNKADQIIKNIRQIDSIEFMPIDAEAWLDFTCSMICQDIIHLTNLEAKAFYYSSDPQFATTTKPYNLLKLLSKILSCLPIHKSPAMLNFALNRGEHYWSLHDKHAQYAKQLVTYCANALLEQTRYNFLPAKEYSRFYSQVEAITYQHLGINKK